MYLACLHCVASQHTHDHASSVSLAWRRLGQLNDVTKLSIVGRYDLAQDYDGR